MLPNIAQLPENEIVNTHEKLPETQYFTENDKLLSPVNHYFENT